MFLAAPFGFPLGGEGLSAGLPWIVNMVPSVDQTAIKLLRPIRFSIRDSETYIDPTSMRVKAGYAKIHSNADQLFDKELPQTKRVALAAGLASEPILSVVGGNVQIQRTTSAPQRSVYATSIDAGVGYNSVMATAILRPDTLSPYDDNSESTPLLVSVFPGPLLPLPYSSVESSVVITDNGTVFGLEHGPRNKVVYVRFQQHSDGTRIVRLTSYAKEDASSPDLNSTIVFDWSSLRRYFIVWNETEGFVEVYGQVSISTQRLFRVLISSVPDMPSDYFIKAGSATTVTMLYGQLGPSGDQSTWANVALSADVAFPVLGNVRPGDFVTVVRGSEIISTDGTKDPRDADVSPWFTTDEDVIADLDPSASVAIDNGRFEMTKVTAENTFSLYREEPGLLTSNSEGFVVSARIEADATLQDGAATGMGVTIYDGQSVFQLHLFDDVGVKTVGLLKKGGSDDDITEYFLPDTPIDWSGRHFFRFVVDPRRNTIRLYDGDNMGQPVMDIPFDRATLPNGSDFGWNGLTPFIVFGHTMPTNTRGTFVLESLDYSHLFQAWDVDDGFAPIAGDPIFTRTTSGGASVATGEEFVITCPTGATDKYSRAAAFGANRGAVVEARLRITSWRPRTRTGVYLLLDDGIRTYALTFVDHSLGKFVALSRRDGSGNFRETVGRDGDAATVSFLLNWEEPHTYRLERHPYNGLKVFVDDELTPRLTYPESKLALLPNPLYGGTPTLAFGHYTTEAAVSRWSFVRGFFSRGYEVSFKKNKPDAVLRDELFDTQAMVVAHAVDTD